MQVSTPSSSPNLVQNAEQLKQRADEDEKEYIRLMKFELKFELIKPSFSFKNESDNAQLTHCFLQGYHFDHKKQCFIKQDQLQTDAVNFSNSTELTIQGKASFIKSMGGALDISTIQRWKVVIVAKLASGTSNCEEHEIGSVEFTVAELFMSWDRQVKKLINFQNSKFVRTSSCKGTLNIIAVTPAPRPHSLPRDVNSEGTHLTLKTDINEFGDAEVQQMSITLKLMVKDLPIMDKSTKEANPYFLVFKDGITFQERLYQSEVIQDTRFATYRTFSFGLANQKSLDKPMMIEFWHHNEHKKPQFIGIMRTDVYDLRNGTTDFNLVDPDTPYQFRGTVHILKYEERIWISEKVVRKAVSKSTGQTRLIQNIVHRNDFSVINYLGYYELRLCVAVDFTASNGQFPERNDRSYHFIGKKGVNNPYQKTLFGISTVLGQYSKQKFIDCFGFGAMNAKGHFRWQKPEKITLERPITDPKTLLKAYKRICKTAEFGFDNDFYKIIQEVRDVAHVTLHYYVLLIVLDGDKIDIVKTLTVLKETEKSGLSVIFVGIGNEKFKTLRMLAREFVNVTFVKYVDDIDVNTSNALRDLPKHVLYHMAIRKNVPETY
jgi:hypothetical protein